MGGRSMNDNVALDPRLNHGDQGKRILEASSMGKERSLGSRGGYYRHEKIMVKGMSGEEGGSIPGNWDSNNKEWFGFSVESYSIPDEGIE
ncbi:hypothetical protein WN943_006684 [Citrus x changshan-huyou]